MKPISFDVLGMEPLPEGNENIREWREYIEKKAEPVKPHLGNYLFGVTSRFAVDLKFFLTSAREMDTDLDNLAKPVLDTLFQDPHNKSDYPSGVLFKCNDSRVIQLRIEKATVQEQDKLGVRIQIDW